MNTRPETTSQDLVIKTGIIWAKHYWNPWSYEPSILELRNDRLCLKTAKTTVFETPISSIFATFTRWGRLILTIENNKYVLLGSGGYRDFTRDQVNEIITASGALPSTSGFSGTMVGAGAGVSAVGGQGFGAALEVLGAAEGARAQFKSQARIEAWYKIFASKNVPMIHKPANAFTIFLIVFGVILVVGLIIALVLAP